MSGESSPSAPSADDDPIVAIVDDVVARLRQLADDPDAVLTCDLLLEVIGNRAHVMAIFIFSLLNLLPGPPGYALVIGLIIIALAVMLLRGHEIHLWPRIGRVKLPLKILMKLVGMLAGLIAIVAKVSTPRLSMIADAGATSVIGLAGVILGIGMLVPIPFTNTIPAIGMAIACVGALNRDGILMLIGIVVGLLGLFVLICSIWILVTLGMVIEDVVVS